MKAITTLAFVFLFLLVTNQVFAQDQSTQKKFHHVLLCQWKDSLDLATKNEVLKLFQELPAKIKGFEKIEIVELAMSTDKFNTIVIQVFDSEEAYRLYEKHPDHLRISKIGPPLVSRFSAFDYWK